MGGVARIRTQTEVTPATHPTSSDAATIRLDEGDLYILRYRSIKELVEEGRVGLL